MEIIVSNETRKIMDFKRQMEALSKDKDQPDRLRYCARALLRPLNDLITEGLCSLVEAGAEAPTSAE